MRKACFFLVFLFFLTVEVRAVDYCRIGADPLFPNRVLSQNEEYAIIEHDTLVNIKSKKKNSVVCVLKKGESVVVDRATKKWKWIPFCGNDFNSEHYSTRAIEKVVEVEKERRPEDEVIIVFTGDDYVAPPWIEQRWRRDDYFVGYTPGYSGYYSGGYSNYNYGRRHDHHRSYTTPTPYISPPPPPPKQAHPPKPGM